MMMHSSTLFYNLTGEFLLPTWSRSARNDRGVHLITAEVLRSPAASPISGQTSPPEGVSSPLRVGSPSRRPKSKRVTSSSMSKGEPSVPMPPGPNQGSAASSSATSIPHDRGMQQLIPIVNKLQDVFAAIGKHPLDLPQIVVIGKSLFVSYAPVRSERMDA